MNNGMSPMKMKGLKHAESFFIYKQNVYRGSNLVDCFVKAMEKDGSPFEMENPSKEYLEFVKKCAMDMVLNKGNDVVGVDMWVDKDQFGKPIRYLVTYEKPALYTYWYAIVDSAKDMQCKVALYAMDENGNCDTINVVTNAFYKRCLGPKRL